MVQRNIISDKGKNGKESFYLIDDGSTIDNVLDDDDLESVSGIETFINDKFCDVLLNKIKSEIKLTLNERSEFNNPVNRNSDDGSELNLENDYKAIKNPTNDLLIEVLKEEIAFLRSELTSKNKIIELLIKDKHISNVQNQHALIDIKSSDTSTKNKRPTNKNKNNTSNHHKIFNGNNALGDENSFSTDEEIEYTVVKKANQNGNNKRSITIIGDSLIKDMESYKMKNGLSSKDRVYIKSFPGAKIECMEDYVKPSIKYNPDVFLLHCGTNDLRSEKNATEIATEIISLANKLKKGENEVIISGLVERNDKWNGKGKQVNVELKLKCAHDNFIYCDNDNLSAKYHVNTSGLHLNENGTIALANNFIKAINV